MTAELHDSLEVVTGRIKSALDILLEALTLAVAEAAADLSSKGIDPSTDAGTYCGIVRLYLRDQIRSIFPHLDKRENMSPVRLVLGPYTLLVGHSRNGDVPPAKTNARKLLYGTNDVGIMVMNMFDDVFVEIEEDVEAVTENTLVLVWNSHEGVLTQAELHRPYMSENSEFIDLLGIAVVESDLDEITRKEEAEEVQAAVVGGDYQPPMPFIDDDDVGEDDEEDDEES